MADNNSLVSHAFQVFLQEAPAHAASWAAAIRGLAGASALDPKTSALAYLAVIAVQRLQGGVAFHVKAAKEAGASRAEVVSAILLGLPAAGNCVTEVLPAAMTAYDAD